MASLGRSRRRVAAVVAAVAAATALGATGARAVDESDPCTDADTEGLDPSCLPGGTAGQLLRQLCDYQWIEGVCETTGLESPQYATDADPSPGQPFVLLVGAVHEHSGYSDGDPAAIPRDYFRAGRTGHNLADDGVSDTGVILDFMYSSEHSDNTQIAITTSAACIDPAGIPDALAALDAAGAVPPLACNHITETDDYWKWPATLRQAIEETEFSPGAGYTGFTGMRGFEWTNDYFNHMNVYFSTNFVNVKIDGSYASMDFFWNWLREPVARGGGADGLVTFNHPGGDPKLTPFDGGFPHTRLLAELKGGSNWNDLAYVPDVDERVAGIEVNGGDDIEWYVKGLTRGWHIGPVTAEDEHQREWATSADGKTLVLARGRSPRDHYFALQNHRTIAIDHTLVGGAPGTRATYPTIHFYADGSGPGGSGIQDPAATVLGSVIDAPGTHTLHFSAAGLPVGSRVALVSSAGGGQAAPTPLGAVDAHGDIAASHPVVGPASGESWYFAVVCPAETGLACGTDQRYSAVTAPIWFR